MTCGECGHESPGGANFCESCGAPSPVETDSPSPEEATQALLDQGVNPALVEQLYAIQAAVDALRADIGQHADRLQLVERILNAPRIDPAPSAPLAQTAPAAAETPVPPTLEPSGIGPSVPQAATAQPRTGTYRPPSAIPFAPTYSDRRSIFAGAAGSLGGAFNRTSGQSWNWEWLFGGNWLARIGVLALIIGVGFFLKLAFDNDWIGETGRVALGLLGGVALLGGGEYWRRKYPILAQPLTGGGIAILYLSVFAAFALYDLIPALPALGFFFLVTVTAAGLALRYESVVIAVLGILSGFATPFLLVDELPDLRAMLAYVLVLDLVCWRWRPSATGAGSPCWG